MSWDTLSWREPAVWQITASDKCCARPSHNYYLQTRGNSLETSQLFHSDTQEHGIKPISLWHPGTQNQNYFTLKPGKKESKWFHSDTREHGIKTEHPVPLSFSGDISGTMPEGTSTLVVFRPENCLFLHFCGHCEKAHSRLNIDFIVL